MDRLDQAVLAVDPQPGQMRLGRGDLAGVAGCYGLHTTYRYLLRRSGTGRGRYRLPRCFTQPRCCY